MHRDALQLRQPREHTSSGVDATRTQWQPPMPRQANSGASVQRTGKRGDPCSSPWKLGVLSLTELARRVMHEIQEDDCLGRAAQLAYDFLFAWFSSFLFLTTLLGNLPIPQLLDRMMEVLAQVQAGDALQLIQEDLHQLITGDRGGLLSFGIVAALWTSSSTITAIIGSLNRAYDLEEGRPFWKVCLMAILRTGGLPAFVSEQAWKACHAGQSTRHIRDLERRQETLSADSLRHEPGSSVGTPTRQGRSLGGSRRGFLDLSTFILRYPTASAAHIETNARKALMCRVPCLRCPLALHASLSEHGTA
jgi:hypothetical protein